jgi:hypothetical protein
MTALLIRQKDCSKYKLKPLMRTTERATELDCPTEIKTNIKQRTLIFLPYIPNNETVFSLLKTTAF